MADEVRPWDLLNPKEERSDEDLLEFRLQICKTCEFYRARTNQCRKCGCFMNMKATLLRAKCPEGKW